MKSHQPAAATVRLAGEFASAVAPGGHVIASGIVQDRAEEAEEALERAGLALRRRVDEGLWVTLVAGTSAEGAALSI